MADLAVVVGGGPGAVRAAASLRDAGRTVVLLQDGVFAGGISDPSLPVDRAVGRAAAGASVFGELRAVPELDRAVIRGGKRVQLPIPPAQVLGLLPMRERPRAAAALGRTRGKRELQALIGGGREVRSYADWVSQRYGAPVLESLHGPYCRKRFGDPEEITGNVARFAHSGAATEPLVAPAQGPGAAFAAALSGVEVRLATALRSIGPGRVETGEGAVEGDVFVDLPPARVVELLGPAAPAGLAATVARLRFRHLVQVHLQGGGDLPFETHVIDADVPFYRLTRPGRLPGCADDLVAHYALEAGDPLWTGGDAELVRVTVESLGRIGLTGTGGRVLRIENYHPVWVTAHATAMRTLALALDELGMAPVGRSGLFTPLEWESEIGWLASLGGEEGIRPRMRRWVDPPVTADDQPAPLVRFIER